MGNNRLDRRGIRKNQAEVRQAAWAQLTPQQQLVELDKRIGESVGAMRQRKRILKRIEKESRNG
jgi:hypothetical protein